MWVVDRAGLAGVLRDGDGRTGAAVDRWTAVTATAATLALRDALTAGLDGMFAPSAGMLTVPPPITVVVAVMVGPTTLAGPDGCGCVTVHTTPPMTPSTSTRHTGASQRGRPRL